MESTSYLPLVVTPGGRTREAGVDCWGLVALIYREQLEIHLPLYEDVNWKDSMDVWIAMAEKQQLQWDEVAAPLRREYDVVLLRIKAIPWHVGVLVDRNRFIHADPARGVRIERLDALHWKNRVVGYHRFKGDKNVDAAAPA